MGVKCNVKLGWRTNQRGSQVSCASRSVDHHMDVEVVGHASLDEVQEPSEHEGAVTLRSVRNHLARGDVEGGVEIGGAVSLVVMGASFGESGS